VGDAAQEELELCYGNEENVNPSISNDGKYKTQPAPWVLFKPKKWDEPNQCQ